MDHMDCIKQMAQSPMFSDQAQTAIEAMDTELKTLFQAGDQIKIREFLSGKKAFADVVEIAAINDK